MNKLYVGRFTSDFEIPKSGILIDDEIREIERSRIFEIAKHSFNPLKNLDYHRARQIADVLYTTTPQGENTLTVRNGRRALLRNLMEAERFDKIQTDDAEVKAMIDDLLISPVLRSVLCNPTNFSFNPNSLIQCPLDRSVICDFDALVLGLLLMSFFKGQVIVPDFGFYGRDAHISLIRQNRLITAVSTLSELSPRLRQSVLLIPDKEASGVTYQDAATLAQYDCRFPPNTDGYDTFIKRVMQ